jgi:hypothetical protein
MINRPTSAGSAPSTDSHRLSLVWPGSAWCDPAGLARPATAGSATPADSRPFIGVRRWSCTTRCGSGCLIGRRVTDWRSQQSEHRHGPLGHVRCGRRLGSTGRRRRCRQLPRLGRGRSAVRGGHPYYARAAAVDRLAWPPRRALARWLGLLSPASSGISSISNIGFIGFFVFMLSMGIALLRRRSRVDEASQASSQPPT